MIANREAWLNGAERLTAAGIESARLDARVLLASVMDIGTAELLTAKDPSHEQIVRYGELLERRIAREPVAYITGEREFWSLTFEVGPGVLIPRPETETLLEEGRRHFAGRQGPRSILDLGTGSGCLLIAALHVFPYAVGAGIDRSREALVWARKNGSRHGVAARATWRQDDWSAVAGRFDLVLANPPYISCAEAGRLDPEVTRFEPRDALFAGEDGLDAYRALAPLLGRVLSPEGRGFLEIGVGQGDSVRQIMELAGLEIVGITPDLAGVPRCMAVGIASPDSGVNSRTEAEKTVGNLRSSR